MKRLHEEYDLYTVYGVPNCSWCEKAKTILEHYGKNFKYIDVIESQENLENLMKKGYPVKTVPQIFLYQAVRGEFEVHIGGYNSLSEWLKKENGKIV